MIDVKCRICSDKLFSIDKIYKSDICLCRVIIMCDSCLEKMIKSEIKHNEQMNHFGLF